MSAARPFALQPAARLRSCCRRRRWRRNIFAKRGRANGLTGPDSYHGSRPAWPGRRRSAAPQHDAFDSAAHRSAARERTNAYGAPGKADGRPTTARALPLGRRRRISARMRGRGRRDPNDGMGFVVGVASVVNLMQETRELAAIESRPVAIQAGEEFELAAREYRHSECRNSEAEYIGPVTRGRYILGMRKTRRCRKRRATGR